MKERLLWLDALKGIGILSIMRVHMLAPMEWIQNLLFTGAVTMFFVIAGLHLKLEISTAEALKGKAWRLLFPYFVYSLLLYLLYHQFTRESLTYFLGIFYGRFSIYPDGSVPLMLIGNPPLWFLPAMFVSYIWVYLFYAKARTPKVQYMWIIIFFVLSLFLSYSPVLLPWSLDTSFMFAAMLMLGFLWRRRFFQTDIRWGLCALALWVGLFITFGNCNISLGQYGPYGAVSYIVFIVAVLCETYALATIMQLLESTWLVRVLAYIGRDSLRLMCLHLYVYLHYQGWACSFFPTLYNHKALFLLSAFLLIILVNAMVRYVLDKLSPYCLALRYL